MKISEFLQEVQALNRQRDAEVFERMKKHAYVGYVETETMWAVIQGEKIISWFHTEAEAIKAHAALIGVKVCWEPETSTRQKHVYAARYYWAKAYLAVATDNWLRAVEMYRMARAAELVASPGAALLKAVIDTPPANESAIAKGQNITPKFAKFARASILQMMAQMEESV